MTAEPFSTAPSAPAPASSLLGTLQEQRNLYQRLKALSERQSSLIAAGQTRQLLQVLSERQTLVESLDTINQRLGPSRNRWAGVARELPEDQRQKLRNLVDEVQSLLQGIIEQDELDRRQLQASQADIGRQLRQVVRTGSAVNAYRSAPVHSSARFTDRQG